jgi:hypothetical protein
MNKERKEHIRKVFEVDESVLIKDIQMRIKKFEEKFQCIKPERIRNHILKRIKEELQR